MTGQPADCENKTKRGSAAWYLMQAHRPSSFRQIWQQNGFQISRVHVEPSSTHVRFRVLRMKNSTARNAGKGLWYLSRGQQDPHQSKRSMFMCFSSGMRSWRHIGDTISTSSLLVLKNCQSQRTVSLPAIRGFMALAAKNQRNIAWASS